MSKTSEINWIDTHRKPGTFREMRDAFCQIRNTMSDWRQKQAIIASSPWQDDSGKTCFLETIPPYQAVPAGTVVYVCSHMAPYGYLKADGSAIEREQYKELFAATGVRFGSGDGISTFNLPDLRGEFIRCLDNGRGVDAGRELGNVQMDEFKSHYHGFLDRPNMRLESGVYTWTPQVMEVAEQDFISTTRAGGSETRPRNIALLACIKI